MHSFIFYKQRFLIQLMIGEGLFLLRMEKKRGFRYLAPVSVVFLFLTVFPLPENSPNPVLSAGQYLFLFLCTLAAAQFCFQEPFQNLLFCGIAGYTVQHLSYLIFTVLEKYIFSGVDALGLPAVDPYSPSASSSGALNPLQTVLYFGIYAADYFTIFFVVYITAFDIFDPLIRSNHNLRLGHANYIFLSGMLIAADVISNMITLFYTPEHTASHALELSYNIALCVIILVLLYNQLRQRALKDELSAVRYILEQGRRQYELAKKTTELINLKYHDLRHQYIRMKGHGSFLQDEKEELRKILSDYDSRIQTGNEALDIILTEKNILCREAGIQLICMADGAGLEFLKPHHLYALLGNAVENAMEAVRDLPEEERFIHLYIRRQGNFRHIHIENAYQGSVTMRDGIPLTSKENQNDHGFGVLSMRTIAESYGGNLLIHAEDGIFYLDVLLSISA